MLPNPSVGTNSSGQASSTVSPRLILTCLTIAATFTVCWTPMNVAVLMVTVGLRYLTNLHMLRWTTVLACFNSCVNPIVYGIMWRPFRKALVDVRIRASVCILWPIIVMGTLLYFRPVVSIFLLSLWPSYVIRQAIIFLPCDCYLLSSSFFPRLISAAADWMSTILPHMM